MNTGHNENDSRSAEAAYLRATASVESDHPQIRELVAKLTDGAADIHETARRIFLWTRDEIPYSLFNPFEQMEHYRATAIIDRGRGYCVQKAVVLCTLARAASIPARLIFVDIINHRAGEAMAELFGSLRFVYHSYVDMYLGDTWVQAVPSFDRNLCAEQGYPVVEFDGHHSALFPDRDAQGRRYIEYVARHGHFDDVPLAAMLQAWEDYYGQQRVASWKIAMANGGPESL